MMIHYTLNTRNRFDFGRKKITREAREALDQLIRRSGGPIPGLGAFRVKINIPPPYQVAAFSILRGQDVCVMNLAVSAEADSGSAWKDLRENVWPDGLDSLPPWEAPVSGPWLATVLLPGIVYQSRRDLSWMADFEQCMAVVLLGIMEELRRQYNEGDDE